MQCAHARTSLMLSYRKSCMQQLLLTTISTTIFWQLFRVVFDTYIDSLLKENVRKEIVESLFGTKSMTKLILNICPWSPSYQIFKPRINWRVTWAKKLLLRVRMLGRPMSLFITIAANQTHLLMTVSTNVSMKKPILFWWCRSIWSIRGTCGIFAKHRYISTFNFFP